MIIRHQALERRREVIINPGPIEERKDVLQEEEEHQQIDVRNDL